MYCTSADWVPRHGITEMIIKDYIASSTHSKTKQNKTINFFTEIFYCSIELGTTMNIVLKNVFYFTYEFLCTLNSKKRIHKREGGGEEFFFLKEECI